MDEKLRMPVAVLSARGDDTRLQDTAPFAIQPDVLPRFLLPGRFRGEFEFVAGRFLRGIRKLLVTVPSHHGYRRAFHRVLDIEDLLEGRDHRTGCGSRVTGVGIWVFISYLASRISYPLIAP